MSAYTYVGSELDLFAAATNWKSYVREQVSPYLGAEVLEVGAGLGGTTKVFCRGAGGRWVCLEPDPGLAARLAEGVRAGTLPGRCEPRVGTLHDVPEGDAYDTILYMDVLEHIEDDRGELARAAARLKPGGHAVVLAPAHQWLYTPFDRAIGHYRRYTKATLKALTPVDLEPVRLVYLDAVGLLASLGNRLVLRSATPTPSQVALWDKVMVRLSRAVDPVIGRSAGKSVLAVWRKRAGGPAVGPQP